MNRWRQTQTTRQYRCPACHATYLHDDAYAHHAFSCQLRPLTNAQRLQRFLMTGRTYEPKERK